MRYREFFLKLALFLFVLLISVSISATIHEQGAGNRICVVAVHDSFLFTMCPTARQQEKRPARLGTQLIRTPAGYPLALPRRVNPQLGPPLLPVHQDWMDLPSAAPDLCLSGRVDVDLKQKIEKEIASQKNFTLVDSLEQADLIFLAEGIYPGQVSGSAVRDPERTRAEQRLQTVLMVAMAIVVPAGVYRQYPANGEMLLKVRLWEGAEVRKVDLYGGRQGANGVYYPHIEPASIRSLVKAFIDQKKSKFPPLCSVFPSFDPTQSLSNAGKRLQSVMAAIPPGGTSGITYKIDVELVTVPVIARDSQGRFVPGLTEKDFHVFENDAEQRIDRVVPVEAPFDVALMLDSSNSTILKHEEIQNAALAFMNAMRPADRLMVVSFWSLIEVDCEFTSNRDLLGLAITRTQAGGNTRLYDAVDLVMAERLNRLPGRKAIVLFTDGFDTQSSLASAASTLASAQKSDVLVYVIRYDTKPTDVSRQALALGAAYLDGLSESSGGRLFNASSVRGLRGAFAEIAEELRHQYALCYYPKESSNDTAFRRIQVTVDKPGIRLRARTGYRPSSKSPAVKR